MVGKAGKVGNMVFVKIVKKEDNKITQETLDLRENDAIYISDNDYPNYWGFKLTQEDFVSLFSRKKAESRAKYEAQQTAKEREIEEKLQKIKEWEAEQERRNSKFLKQLPDSRKYVILSIWENHRARRLYPSYFSEGSK